MANFSKAKEYAVVIPEGGLPVLKKASPNKLGEFTHTEIDGPLEVVPITLGNVISDTIVMLLDEEGKLKGKDINVYATVITRGILADHDLIVGHAVLLKKVGFELELFTKEEAGDVILAIKRSGNRFFQGR